MRPLSRNLLIGAVALSLLATLLYSARAKRQRKHAEILLDEALEETFPASDPPATQDFSIPVNRS